MPVQELVQLSGHRFTLCNVPVVQTVFLSKLPMPITRASSIAAAPAVFVLLWSTGYVGARYATPSADPITFTAIRYAIVALIIAVIVAITRRKLPKSPRMLLHLAISGVLIHACFIGCTFAAVSGGVAIGVAALIAGTQPLITAMIVGPLLGEVITRRQWFGFVVGFIGLALVVIKSIGSGTLTSPLLALCVAALLGITVGTIYQKRFIVDVDLWGGSLVQVFAAFVVCAVYASCFEAGHIEWNAQVIGALLWLCFALSIGAVGVLLILIREGAASKVASLFYLVPPLTALHGYVLFGERLSLLQIMGIGITAVGVAMVNAGASEQPSR